jgi:adenine/guanine phosphoribosyltransferase-like PRPP-binding protein
VIKKTGYLSNLFYPKLRQYTISWLISSIKESKLEFDFIAVRGISGVFAGSLVSEVLEKPIAIVRKDDGCHSGYSVEYVLPEKENYKYIIIDDLVSSGNTISTIKNKVNKNLSANCVGVFIYSQHELDDADARALIKNYIGNVYIDTLNKWEVISSVQG